MVAPAAYGNSQAKGGIRAAAAGLCHSTSHAGSKLRLRPTPLFVANQILNKLSKARDQTCILMDTSRVLNPPSHNGNSFLFFNYLCYSPKYLTLELFLTKKCVSMDSYDIPKLYDSPKLWKVISKMDMQFGVPSIILRFSTSDRSLELGLL